MKNYSTTEAAGFLRELGVPFTKGTLEVWRSRRTGPKFIKVRSRVFYREEDLREFASGTEIKTTDQILSVI